VGKLVDHATFPALSPRLATARGGTIDAGVWLSFACVDAAAAACSIDSPMLKKGEWMCR